MTLRCPFPDLVLAKVELAHWKYKRSRGVNQVRPYGVTSLLSIQKPNMNASSSVSCIRFMARNRNVPETVLAYLECEELQRGDFSAQT